MPTIIRDAHIQHTQAAGNGLFASRAFEPGQCILQLARPLVTVLDAAHVNNICGNCFAGKGAGIGGGLDGDEVPVKACTGCGVARYCGKKCQSQAWKRHHKVECSLFKRMPLNLLSTSIRAVVQIHAMYKTGSINEEHLRMIRDSESHAREFREMDGLADGLRVLSWIEQTTERSLEVDGISAEELRAKILTNSLTIVTPTFDPLGISFDPLVSAANHSCSPNAFIVMDGPILSLRSLARIPADDEIRISYIDPTNPTGWRQSELQHRYFFLCDCIKCNLDLFQQTDEFAIPVKELSPQWCTKADAMIRGWEAAASAAQARGSKDESETKPVHLRKQYWIGNDIDSQRAAALQAAMMTRLAECRRELPTDEAIPKLEEALMICAETKLFGLGRQPYAALRHEFLVSMIAVGQFEIALGQAVRTYFEVDPLLYAEEWHPLRAAHTWAFIRLLLYVLGEPNEREFIQSVMSAYEMDFAVVLFNVIDGLRKQVGRSHGENSSLAKAVEREWRNTLESLPDAKDIKVQEAYRGAMEKNLSQLKKFGQSLPC